MSFEFKKTKKYKNKYPVHTPIGIIPKGTILTGREWSVIMVYDMGNGSEKCFKIIE